MLKRICDNCGEDTGTQRRCAWSTVEKMVYGDQKFPITIRFHVEPPADTDEEEGPDLCKYCLREALEIHVKQRKPSVGAELFNGS